MNPIQSGTPVLPRMKVSWTLNQLLPSSQEAKYHEESGVWQTNAVGRVVPTSNYLRTVDLVDNREANNSTKMGICPNVMISSWDSLLLWLWEIIIKAEASKSQGKISSTKQNRVISFTRKKKLFPDRSSQNHLTFLCNPLGHKVIVLHREILFYMTYYKSDWNVVVHINYFRIKHNNLINSLFTHLSIYVFCSLIKT